MHKILFIVIALLALLAIPVIANQAPPCIGFGLAVESPTVVAIDTYCLDLKIEQAVLTKAFLDSNTRLSENLTRWTFYNRKDCELIGGGFGVQGVWTGNIGYCWQR